MQTRLPSEFLSSKQGQQADRILRSCVHCGFCTATCPTYQLLGDELDSPRGRIYLIKQMLEGNEVSERTQQHLDRCLTCRACETTCPSGVEYGRLVDIGREWVEKKTRRPLLERSKRLLLRKIIPYPFRLRSLIRMGLLVKPLLPAALKQKIPALSAKTPWPQQQHTRKMLILNGCAQSVIHPQIDAATARVLDHFNIQVCQEKQPACCGAVNQHLAAGDDARSQMRHNIDYWWPRLKDDIECIVVTASGCAAHMKEYHHYFDDDPAYREKAQWVSSHVRDISEIMATLPVADRINTQTRDHVAFHSPCTLQHGQQINNLVEPLLQQCGYQVSTPVDAHLCCGSAGTYSILQPTLSGRLLDNKLNHLYADKPDFIATANIGCLMQLQTRSTLPVLHWIELIDKALS